MAERLAQAVADKAPLGCPDRTIVRNLDININLHNYRAYFNDRGEVECLGTVYPECLKCELRVASYTIETHEGSRRVLVGAVTYNSPPSEVK